MVAEQKSQDGASVILLGVTEASWEYMVDGMTHNIDLTKVGIPVKLIIFGSKDRETAIKSVGNGAEVVRRQGGMVDLS